ncbi:MAG TPA: hypothetical protein VMG62_01650, partial [Solirubrobacteraceae bacterium]|nr:hypothetical protein [Solirubrobacteraceae bacterium]
MSVPTETRASAEAQSAPDTHGPQASGAPAASCRNCGAPMQPGQDWCLSCGAGAPGSLESGGPGWRSATTLLIATAVLVLGAGAAAYAALNKSAPPKPPLHVITVAQAPTTATAPATTAPPASTPPTSTPTPAPTGGSSAPGAVKPLAPNANPPKIPTTAPIPK